MAFRGFCIWTLHMVHTVKMIWWINTHKICKREEVKASMWIWCQSLLWKWEIGWRKGGRMRKRKREWEKDDSLFERASCNFRQAVGRINKLWYGVPMLVFWCLDEPSPSHFLSIYLPQCQVYASFSEFEGKLRHWFV